MSALTFYEHNGAPYAGIATFCSYLAAGASSQIIYNLFIDKLPNLWYNIITVKETKRS